LNQDVAIGDWLVARIRRLLLAGQHGGDIRLDGQPGRLTPVAIGGLFDIRRFFVVDHVGVAAFAALAPLRFFGACHLCAFADYSFNLPECDKEMPPAKSAVDETGS
jgi:hypothetical protein